MTCKIKINWISDLMLVHINNFHGSLLIVAMTAEWLKEGDTPPFGTQYSGGDLDGTQYAKGRYTVRRNSVILYADINFYFKRVQFSLKKHNTHDIQSQITKKIARSLRSRFLGSFRHFFNLNMDLRRSKSRKFNTQTRQS